MLEIVWTSQKKSCHVHLSAGEPGLFSHLKTNPLSKVTIVTLGWREGDQKVFLSPVPLAHACNLSYSGGRDQEDHGSKPAQGNSS
jgi:hypothetical protein